MDLILISVLGYLVGAVPFAFVIGKLFYRTDVRQHGSGNLGGSNTGRILGKKAGVAVMTLDILKVTLVVFLACRISSHPWAVACGAVSSALGHCYPIFLHFRGGKAVATMYGLLFSLWVCVGYSPMTFFLPLFTFLAVLYLFKIVALSSMISAAAAVIYLWLAGAHISILAAGMVFALLIILRHRENILRMRQGAENKVRWLR